MPKPRTHDAMDALIDAIGLEDALRAIEFLGGTNWYMPKRLGAGHTVVELLGAEVAERLRAAFERDYVRIPRDKRALDALVARDYDGGRGLSQNKLAIKYRMDVRSVQNALSRHAAAKAAAAQGDVWESA